MNLVDGKCPKHGIVTGLKKKGRNTTVQICKVCHEETRERWLLKKINSFEIIDE